MKKIIQQHWKYILACLVIVIAIRVFFPNYRVVSTSMEPTFTRGTIIYVNRFYYQFKPIQRGDIVLLAPQEKIFTKGVWVHRVIAVEGDRVTIEKQKVIVNDKETQFSVLKTNKYEDVIVPKGKVYQKGDSTNTIYGLVDKKAILGKVLVYF